MEQNASNTRCHWFAAAAGSEEEEIAALLIERLAQEEVVRHQQGDGYQHTVQVARACRGVQSGAGGIPLSCRGA